MPEVPADLQAFFLAAGWYPGRVVPVPEGVPGGHPAAGILAGFLGLKVFNPGAGEECPTSDIDFMAQPFEDSSHELYEATVGEHLRHAYERYGVGKRTLVAIHALFDGTIGFLDVLRR